MPIFRTHPSLLPRFRVGDREALSMVYWHYVDIVETIIRRGFFMAYMEPAGGGERIWFAPRARGGEQGFQVPASDLPQVLPEGMMLETVRAGSYTVHLALARRPLDATEILRENGDDVLATSTTTIEVTP